MQIRFSQAIVFLIICFFLQACNQIDVLKFKTVQSPVFQNIKESISIEDSGTVIIFDTTLLEDLTQLSPWVQDKAIIHLSIAQISISWTHIVRPGELHFEIWHDNVIIAKSEIPTYNSSGSVPLEITNDVEFLRNVEDLIFHNEPLIVSYKIRPESDLNLYEIDIETDVGLNVILESCEEMPPGVDLPECME